MTTDLISFRGAILYRLLLNRKSCKNHEARLLIIGKY